MSACLSLCGSLMFKLPCHLLILKTFLSICSILDDVEQISADRDVQVVAAPDIHGVATHKIIVDLPLAANPTTELAGYVKT